MIGSHFPSVDDAFCVSHFSRGSKFHTGFTFEGRCAFVPIGNRALVSTQVLDHGTIKRVAFLSVAVPPFEVVPVIPQVGVTLLFGFLSLLSWPNLRPFVHVVERLPAGVNTGGGQSQKAFPGFALKKVQTENASSF